MPRNITSGIITAIQAQNLRVALFVEATFATGPVYIWNGIGNYTWNSHTWTGVGTLGSVSTVEESSSVEAKGITISLSGIDPTLLSDVMDDLNQGLAVLVWLGLFDDTGTTLIPNPILSFAGTMDQPTITVGGETATISINCESRLSEMNTPAERRLTNEDQQMDHPGDRGLEFVGQIQQVTIYWGRVPNSKNNL
jgi:hypothetical protein